MCTYVKTGLNAHIYRLRNLLIKWKASKSYKNGNKTEKKKCTDMLYNDA